MTRIVVRSERIHIMHQWMLATGVPEQSVRVLWDAELEHIWVVAGRGAYRMEVGSDDARYAFQRVFGEGPELVSLPFRPTKDRGRPMSRKDRYTAWAYKWGRGPVKAIYLPVSGAYAIGEDDTHLATYGDPPHVVTFASYEAATRIATRANQIINGRRK